MHVLAVGMEKHVKLKLTYVLIGAVCDCVFVFGCMHACRHKRVCVCFVHQCVFVCGFQKATNIKLLDHNFSSPTLHNAKEYAQCWRHTSLSSSRIMVMYDYALNI